MLFRSPYPWNPLLTTLISHHTTLLLPFSHCWPNRGMVPLIFHFFSFVSSFLPLSILLLFSLFSVHNLRAQELKLEDHFTSSRIKTIGASSSSLGGLGAILQDHIGGLPCPNSSLGCSLGNQEHKVDFQCVNAV